MWYFAWVLGLGLAVSFGILNGIWHEFHEGLAAPADGWRPGDARPDAAGD
jgi:cyd operon protein YbgT